MTFLALYNMHLQDKLKVLISQRDELNGQIKLIEEMLGMDRGADNASSDRPEEGKQKYKYNPDGTVDVLDWEPPAVDQGKVKLSHSIIEADSKIEEVKTDVYEGKARVHYIGPMEGFEDNPGVVVNI